MVLLRSCLTDLATQHTLARAVSHSTYSLILSRSAAFYRTHSAALSPYSVDALTLIGFRCMCRFGYRYIILPAKHRSTFYLENTPPRVHSSWGAPYPEY